MNKALPIEKLRGVVFGEPLKAQYRELCSQIGKSRHLLSHINLLVPLFSSCLYLILF